MKNLHRWNHHDFLDELLGRIDHDRDHDLGHDLGIRHDPGSLNNTIDYLFQLSKFFGQHSKENKNYLPPNGGPI
jgi:hypothetical protein